VSGGIPASWRYADSAAPEVAVQAALELTLNAQPHSSRLAIESAWDEAAWSLFPDLGQAADSDVALVREEMMQVEAAGTGLAAGVGAANVGKAIEREQRVREERAHPHQVKESSPTAAKRRMKQQLRTQGLWSPDWGPVGLSGHDVVSVQADLGQAFRSGATLKWPGGVEVELTDEDARALVRAAGHEPAAKAPMVSAWSSAVD